MKKAEILLVVWFVFLFAAGAAEAVTLAWDKDTETWTENTEVAVLVREAPGGAYKAYPDRFSALGATAALEDGFFEAGKTYYVTVTAIENGYMSEESNQVTLEATHEDPLAGVPVMVRVSPPGPAVSLTAQ